MKMFVFLALLGAACAGRLENNYLPPSGAAYSGGSNGALQAPYPSSNRGSASNLVAKQAPIEILKYSNENNGEGTYQYSYETANGIRQQESGSLRNAGTDAEAIAATGSYSFTGEDGVVYTVNWTADENGFRAEGAHLPTPPPTPDAILKSLAQNAAEEAAATRNSGYQVQAPKNAYIPPKNAYVPPQRPNKPAYSEQSGYNY